MTVAAGSAWLRGLEMAVAQLGGDSDPRHLRARVLARYPSALELAERFDHQTVRTPALELVAERTREAVTTRGGRLVIALPPQEMKTTHLRWLCAWILARDPSTRLAYVSYAASLARASGRTVRGVVQTHGHELGLELDRSHADAADWQLAGYRGGMVTVGIGGALTGRPADCMIIDDPLRNQQDADSEAVRTAMHEWWSSVGRTRLSPGAPVIVVQTRWHMDDLAGRRIDEGWPLVNIPALADGDTPDALGREPGEYLESTRGRTPEDWEGIRADVGERTWAALYQGRPAPLAGGIFQRSWIDAHRAQVVPDELVATTVAVDPADTGEADAAGILVGSRAVDGTMFVRADLSGQLSQGQWGRRACLAAVRFGADTIHQERNLGMGRALRDAWAVIVRQAAALAASPANGHGDEDRVRGALVILDAAGDRAAADEDQIREVLEVLDEVVARPSSAPCRITAVTPRMSKYVRAHAVSHLYETGRARHVGRLPLLEHEMVTWQPGQKSPNRLDTLAHLLTHLDVSRNAASIAVPSGRRGAGVPTSTAQGGGRRGGASSVRGRPSVRR